MVNNLTKLNSFSNHSFRFEYEMFYRQIIAHQGILFDLRIPNKNTLQAMHDARNGKGKKYGSVDKMFQDLES